MYMGRRRFRTKLLIPSGTWPESKSEGITAWARSMAEAKATTEMTKSQMKMRINDVSLQLTNPDRPDRYLAYYGRYDVNVHQGLVRHYVEQGSRPGLRDRTLALEYELPDDDTLILLLRGDDDVAGRATWQRHR